MNSFHVKRILSAIVVAPIRAYRRLVSPLLPARCRFYPTCSQYALEAVRELGPLRGAIVAAWRLARCNPWSAGGLDPLSQRRIFRDRGHDGCREHVHPSPPRNGATA